MKRFSNIFFLLFALAFLVVSCDETKTGKPEDVETMTSGKLTIFVDESLSPIMDSVYSMYQKQYPDVKLTIERGTARQAMASLFAGKSRAIVIGRDYLPDEDSILKANKIEKYESMNIAQDGLIFFTGKNSVLDTLNSKEIASVLTEKNYELKKTYAKLPSEPIFAVSNVNSSEYANFKMLAAKGKNIVKYIKMFSTTDSVKLFVKNNPNAIGVAYYHSLIKDTNYKSIRIGFTDSTGNYKYPETIHPANFLQGNYPYVVTFKVMKSLKTLNLSHWFTMFVSKEAKVTTYLKECGLIPSYAKFVLIKED